MLLFVTVALGRCCSGRVERRGWIGVAGVVTVVAAGLAAYGLNSAFGEPTISLSLCRSLFARLPSCKLAAR